LNEQKKNNVAILFIGEDLDILLELCDRILVMCNGSITGIVKSDETTKEDLGYMMTGNMEREGIFYV
jgi:simple sugar transport system ATP-binding protein